MCFVYSRLIQPFLLRGRGNGLCLSRCTSTCTARIQHPVISMYWPAYFGRVDWVLLHSIIHSTRLARASLTVNLVLWWSNTHSQERRVSVASSSSFYHLRMYRPAMSVHVTTQPSSSFSFRRKDFCFISNWLSCIEISLLCLAGWLHAGEACSSRNYFRREIISEVRSVVGIELTSHRV